ncbi:MAG: hypothetical protein LKF43_00280 [Streptococcaceae bacterium]|jgi:hypothetical protein|nr:hypothetical protein [Streptococcaceae bacterium]
MKTWGYLLITYVGTYSLLLIVSHFQSFESMVLMSLAVIINFKFWEDGGAK